MARGNSNYNATASQIVAKWSSALPGQECWCSRLQKESSVFLGPLRLPLSIPRSLRRRGSGDTMPSYCRELCIVSPEPGTNVRARLIESPTRYRSSSAAAHARGRDDALVKVRPLNKLVPNWRSFLCPRDS